MDFGYRKGIKEVEEGINRGKGQGREVGKG